MQISETRHALLARLAWELRVVRVGSVLVASGHGETVLWVLGRGGRKEAVLAVHHPDRWRLLWRGTELDGRRPADAARHIAAAVAA